MNAHYRFRTVTDPSSVSNIAKVLGSSRALRWFVPLVAAAIIAVIIMSAHDFRSPNSATATGSAAVRPSAAVPLIGPEEQVFIDRVRHARVDSVGHTVSIESSKVEPLIGPEEQVFIDRVRHARVASIGGTVSIESSKAERLIGPEEQAFINHLRARLASVYRPVLVSRFAPFIIS